MLEFDVTLSHFDIAWGHFDIAWQKLWHKNDVFDEILGCAGHLTLTKKKWAPVAVKIFYKYASRVLHTTPIFYRLGIGDHYKRLASQQVLPLVHGEVQGGQLPF